MLIKKLFVPSTLIDDCQLFINPKTYMNLIKIFAIRVLYVMSNLQIVLNLTKECTNDVDIIQRTDIYVLLISKVKVGSV